MYQNYNGYYPQSQIRTTQQQTIIPTQLGLKGRPVSSLEEARATSIDFDGSVFYFPDLANRRIYTKQINMDGTATLNMYELKEIPMTPSSINSSVDYVTREEFKEALKKIQESLMNRGAADTAESSNDTQDAPTYSF